MSDSTMHPPDRIAQLRQYGTFSLAYSTLQPKLKYYPCADGYLAYVVHMGTRFVLADPVAPVPAWPRLVERFLRDHPRSCFCQISRPMAELLVRHGFAINEFGTDFRIPIDGYGYSGSKKFHIRYAERTLTNSGFRIAELHETSVCWNRVRSVSELWKRRRPYITRETAFLSRPIVFDREVDTRKFFVVGPDGIVAFVFFDPIYQSGEIIGYLSNAKRFLESAPEGFDFAVTKFALERFRHEGKRLVHLGAAPFFGVSDCDFPANPITSRIARMLYPRKWIYNFQGIAQHKARYRGLTEKIYIATRKAVPVFELIRLARVCKVL